MLLSPQSLALFFTVVLLAVTAYFFVGLGALAGPQTRQPHGFEFHPFVLHHVLSDRLHCCRGHDPQLCMGRPNRVC